MTPQWRPVDEFEAAGADGRRVWVEVRGLGTFVQYAAGGHVVRRLTDDVFELVATGEMLTRTKNPGGGRPAGAGP